MAFFLAMLWRKLCMLLAKLLSSTQGAFGWIQQAQVFSASPQTLEFMGFHAAMDGDGNTMAVSGHRRDNSGVDKGGMYIFVRTGNSWAQQALLEETVNAGSLMGQSVTISSDGNTAAAGAHNDDTDAANAGIVFIYTRTGSSWALQKKLSHPSPAVGQNFGVAVSLSSNGDTLVVGSPGDNTNTGSAQVFTRSGSTWSLHSSLVHSGAITSDNTGNEVAISGDGTYLIVSTSTNTGPMTFSGFGIDWKLITGTWTEGNRLEAQTVTASEFFGFKCRINTDGSYVICSVGGATIDSLSNAGRVDAFKRVAGDLVFDQSFNSPVPEAGAFFGGHMDIDSTGANFIIAAGDADAAGTDSGIVYTYTRSGSTITQQDVLSPNDPNAFDYFGYGMGMSDDGTYACIGATNNDDTLTDQGSVYVFKRG